MVPCTRLQQNNIKQVEKQVIFVFGSNLAGRHGAGSALEAKKNWGAITGVGHGRQGNSYAIPTKDEKLSTLPLDIIKFYVDRFQAYAYLHPNLEFHVVPIGCGLAGYTPKEIAPMFDCILDNVKLPKEFKENKQ
jgi:hypothetical protein